MERSPFDIKDFRQPLVASLGVILGFLIGFLGQWVTEEDFALRTLGDDVVLLGCCAGASLLFTALFRMLSPNVSAVAALPHYRLTLKLVMLGLVASLGSLLVSAFV